ncbi:GNAT family N-acetyltransferase [Muricoccus radiodurans]|uniref:GNAT family N-acetyltransferase n=1 Tax=Muricoccus radiodurans TaxID=2231721 RepID=UPI003CFBA2EB
MPLAFETRLVFDPARNPVLAEWHLRRFLAWRDGRVVGRIVAAMPRNGHGGIGHFGFLAVEQDAAVLAALLEAARSWLVARGATRLRGPLSFSINHEVGARVEGEGAMLRMPRNPPWLPAMLDAAGLTREKDVLACTLTVAEERHRARFRPLLARWEGTGDLTIRPLRVSHLASEVEIVRDLFNDAWAENWGAMPVSRAEAEVMRGLLAPLLLAGRVFFAAWRGEAIGLLSIVPNIEAATARAEGQLWPFGWAGLAGAALGFVDSARVPMLGIRRAWRGTAVSAMATGALLDHAITLAERRRWARVEISWILEDNGPMRRLMAALPAPVTGRWRIWRGPA